MGRGVITRVLASSFFCLFKLDSAVWYSFRQMGQTRLRERVPR